MAALSCNSSGRANVPGHLLQHQPATANKFQMGDWYNRSNDMKMLWDPLCHFTGVVSVALRHVFTSAISNNHIPQGNLDWMCTYTGLKLFYKWEQITVAASAVSSFWHWHSLFHSFAVWPMRLFSACGLYCRWRKKVCVVVVVFVVMTMISAAEQQWQLSRSITASHIIYNTGAGDHGSPKFWC